MRRAGSEFSEEGWVLVDALVGVVVVALAAATLYPALGILIESTAGLAVRCGQAVLDLEAAMRRVGAPR